MDNQTIRNGHNPYFNRWFSAITTVVTGTTSTTNVTILILIDGFLQFSTITITPPSEMGHNPYFNRWFSAIKHGLNELEAASCHNPYFNRWFSAI